MLNDLLSSYKWNLLNKSQVLNLLGQPDYSSDSDIVYKVVEDYGTDIDPVYTKQLEVKLMPDQSVKAVEVNEWKKWTSANTSFPKWQPSATFQLQIINQLRNSCQATVTQTAVTSVSSPPLGATG